MILLPFDVAKALKDAGWPNHPCSGNLGRFVWSDDGKESAYSPELSELIDACPKILDRFEFTLCWDDARHEDYAWWARYQNNHETGFELLEPKGKGKTHEEAVARLYLALPEEWRVKC